MNYFSYHCIRNGDHGVWCILTVSRPGFQFLLVLVIPVPSRRRFGTVSFSPQNRRSPPRTSYTSNRHPKLQHGQNLTPLRPSRAFTPRERCRVQIPTVQFYGPNSRISTPPPPPPGKKNNRTAGQHSRTASCHATNRQMARYFESYTDLAFVLFRAGAYGVPFGLGHRGAGRTATPPVAYHHHRTRMGVWGTGTMAWT